MKGWISIHRQIRAHWIWENEKYLKAWIDLLLMMNHKDAKVLFRNELIEVKRGERITSQVKLSKRWNWSRGKVRKFLEMLENDDMIILKTDKRKTVINVVNYDTYQISDAPKSQQKANRKPTESQEKDTNNNDNNDNNDNNNTHAAKAATKIDVKKENVPYEKIAKLYNDILGKLIPPVTSLTKTRKTKIRTRWKNELKSLKDWENVFKAVKEQKFCLGENNSGWNVTLDWLIANGNNHVKVTERQYANSGNGKSKNKNKFHDMQNNNKHSEEYINQQLGIN